jgi:hypothetical protein
VLVSLVKNLGPRLIKGLGSAMLNVGKAIGTGILDGLGDLGHLLLTKVKDAIGWVAGKVGSAGSSIGKALNPFGDGIGTGPAPSSALSGGNGLMGARSILAPFAGLAGRFGLHTSSGLRPGAVTVSGNRSYHATGTRSTKPAPRPGCSGTSATSRASSEVCCAS